MPNLAMDKKVRIFENIEETPDAFTEFSFAKRLAKVKLGGVC